MSGNILYRTAAAPPDDYTRAVFAFDDGHELRWTDLRKFGTMWLVEDATMVMEALGPEPLDADFTPDVLRRRAGNRGAPIKSVLLDQTVLAGMGNLYTDEALHYAKIHPLRPANKLKATDWERLHAGIVRALRMGLDARGSSLGTTLRDHINVDGAPGQNQETVQAYGREGEACYEWRGHAADQGRRTQQRHSARSASRRPAAQDGAPPARCGSRSSTQSRWREPSAALHGRLTSDGGVGLDPRRVRG
jgi:formamidopyrimidine-DNA glycosylase